MKTQLEEYGVNLRIKLSALWTAVMFCYIYGDYFELYVPKKVEGLLNGHNMLDTPIKLFTTTFILAIPALMIFLSLMLSPKLTKWLNIGIGIFFTVFTLLVGIASISEWRMFYVFLAILESIITIIIIEMFDSLYKGDLSKDFYIKQPHQLGKVLLEDFAKEFTDAYNNPS